MGLDRGPTVALFFETGIKTASGLLLPLLQNLKLKALLEFLGGLDFDRRNRGHRRIISHRFHPTNIGFPQLSGVAGTLRFAIETATLKARYPKKLLPDKGPAKLVSSLLPPSANQVSRQSKFNSCPIWGNFLDT
jgi:hypothetical protein